MSLGIIGISLGILNLALLWIIYKKLKYEMKKEYELMYRSNNKQIENELLFKLVGIRRDLSKDIRLLMDYLNVEIESIKETPLVRKVVPKIDKKGVIEWIKRSLKS